jgi:CheY-like chemotaxis protein
MTLFQKDAACSPTILIVDDTEMHRRVLTAVVEGLGMCTRSVESGEAALAFCRKESVDAILMDIEMPGLSGFDTARAIHALQGAERTPIIAVTSNTCTDLGQRTRRAGIALCLQKPVRPAEIAHALRAVLLKSGDAQALSA